MTIEEWSDTLPHSDAHAQTASRIMSTQSCRTQRHSHHAAQRSAAQHNAAVEMHWPPTSTVATAHDSICVAHLLAVPVLLAVSVRWLCVAARSNNYARNGNINKPYFSLFAGGKCRFDDVNGLGRAPDGGACNPACDWQSKAGEPNGVDKGYGVGEYGSINGANVSVHAHTHARMQAHAEPSLTLRPSVFASCSLALSCLCGFVGSGMRPNGILALGRV